MKWLIIPDQVVDRVVLDKQTLTSLSSIALTEELPASFSLKLEHEYKIVGTSASLSENSRLIGLWRPDDLTEMLGNHYLSIWCDPSGSNISSFDGEEREEILERICRLAYHIWNRIPFPDFWYAKKIEGFDSIFAGNRTVLNLRFAYSYRKIDDINLLDIGNFYYSKTHEQSATVPLTDIRNFHNISTIFHPPRKIDNISVLDISEESLDGPLEDGDIRIEPHRAAYHLFSLSYDQWTTSKGPLTTRQIQIIRHIVKKPLRIHGPAGSGKTLVLILKALYLLRDAVEKNLRCHVLFIATSNAVKQTISSAIEMIDNKMFLATTREDLQYLDVETLHGWCIRELGLEDGSGYVLEKDPKESKQRQLGILTTVFDKVMNERYSKMRDMLSEDFVKMIEHHREALIKELQREISIRIKGRGFRIGDRNLYIESPIKTFIGSKANMWDRHFIYHIYEKYESLFKEENLLDTDDVVLSMSARLSTSLWDRQRKNLGYDFIMVDETHLFNDNERRVLPLLTRGETEYPNLIMTFDENQSIGGTRGIDLKGIGIPNSERRNLKSVHRSSPDIFALARDLVERSPLAFTEFLTENNISIMRKDELKRCMKPSVIYVEKNKRWEDVVADICSQHGKLGHKRIGLIIFNNSKLNPIKSKLINNFDHVVEVEERGEKLSALPKPGIYIMTPETCGGLEFEAVLLIGVDKGCVPVPLGDVSREGYQSVLEEAYIELYTAVTRAKYVLRFISDEEQGISEILKPSIKSGLLEEMT